MVMLKNYVKAIIWDYDCTLADTWSKNLVVTRKLIAHVTGRETSHISALKSLEQYRAASIRSINWREFYTRECGLTEVRTDQAGQLWTEFQLQDETPVHFFDGIVGVLSTLKHIPHGVVSQNSKQRIANSLQENGLAESFESIVGYEEVDFDKQKPAPDALLLCIEELVGFATGSVLYVGDHEVDTACVFHANQAFQQKELDIHVKSVGAFYGCDHDDADWAIKPDYTARTVQDILLIVQDVELRN